MNAAIRRDFVTCPEPAVNAFMHSEDACLDSAILIGKESSTKNGIERLCIFRRIPMKKTVLLRLFVPPTLFVIFLIAPAFAGRAEALDNWHWRNPGPVVSRLTGVTYGNGLYVAVGEQGTIETSPDGIQWTLRHS